MSTTSRQTQHHPNARSNPLEDPAMMALIIVMSILLSAIAFEMGLFYVGVGIGIVAILALVVVFMVYLAPGG